MTRGYRNNNPGNIRHNGIKYLGEVSGSDDSFKSFESMAYGYRAIFVVLNAYDKKGVRTIDTIVSRYAPTNENHTDKYIDFVESKSGVGRNVVVTSTNKDVMIPIVAAMSHMENGVAPKMSEVNAGWELFIKHKP